MVVIQWRDSLTGPTGWTDKDEAVADAVDAFANPLSAAGFLISDTAECVVIASGYNPHTDEVQGSLMIPRSEVVALDVLRESVGSERPEANLDSVIESVASEGIPE